LLRLGTWQEADDTLRFVTADGRTIPRNGYRLEDFVDDFLVEGAGDADNTLNDPPRDGCCTTRVQPRPAGELDVVREPAAVYRIGLGRMRAS
jgi:hypothetical protein